MVWKVGNCQLLRREARNLSFFHATGKSGWSYHPPNENLMTVLRSLDSHSALHILFIMCKSKVKSESVLWLGDKNASLVSWKLKLTSNTPSNDRFGKMPFEKQDNFIENFYFAHFEFHLPHCEISNNRHLAFTAQLTIQLPLYLP